MQVDTGAVFKELESLVRELIDEEPEKDDGEGYDNFICCVFCGKEAQFNPFGQLPERSFKQRHETNCWLIRAQSVLDKLNKA